MPPILHRAAAISLRQLLPHARFLGGADVEVASWTTDARKCRPGDLYIALVEAERDGHEEVAEAIQRGARGVLAERLVPATVPTCLVRDTRHAQGLLCHALSGRPCDELRVAGITGSNGKTVTAHLLASILRQARLGAGLISSLSAVAPLRPEPYGVGHSASEYAQSLRRVADAGQSHAVVEVSSEGLATRQTAGMEFDAAIVTNVRRDHAGDHGSLLQYRRLKTRLFEHLKPGGFAVVNVDDPASESFMPHLRHPVLTIGLRNDAEISAQILERSAGEQTFLFQAGPEAIPVCTRMLGDHHVYNCLSAAAVAIAWGIDLPTIVRGLEAVTSLPGRLERIDCGQPFQVYIETARTPDALTAALRTVRQVTRGRVICVFGAEGERNHDLRPQLGRVLEKLAHVRVLTSDNPRGESPLEIVHGLLDGFQRPGHALVRPDREAAITWALDQARPGDAVVVAGKGEAGFHECGTRRIPWDDRGLVRHYLYNRPSDEPRATADRPVLKIFG